MRYEQEYTFVMDRMNKLLYGVKGITDSLSFLLREQTLPCMVQYTILPYKDFFILDSIGTTKALKDFSYIIELYEDFRSIAKDKGAMLSASEAASFRVLNRNMQETKEDLFSDFINPFSGYLYQKGFDEQGKILEAALAAWNLSYGSDEQAKEYFNRDMFKEYIKPLMEYRRTAFANVRFLIDRLEPPLEGETLMRVIEKKDVEQLELELDM